MPMAKQMPKKIYFYCGDYAIVCLTSCCFMQMFQPYLPCKLYSCTYQPRCLEHGSTSGDLGHGFQPNPRPAHGYALRAATAIVQLERDNANIRHFISFGLPSRPHGFQYLN